MLIKDGILYIDKFKKISLASKEAKKFCVSDKIYVASGNGAVIVYSLYGKLETLISTCQHVVDICTDNNFVFGISFHDNVIFRINNTFVDKKLYVSVTPQNIYFNKNLYCVAFDGNYSYIFLLSDELEIIKKIKLAQDSGKLEFGDKLVFIGENLKYELDENLKIRKIIRL